MRFDRSGTGVGHQRKIRRHGKLHAYRACAGIEAPVRKRPAGGTDVSASSRHLQATLQVFHVYVAGAGDDLRVDAAYGCKVRIEWFPRPRVKKPRALQALGWSQVADNSADADRAGTGPGVIFPWMSRRSISPEPVSTCVSRPICQTCRFPEPVVASTGPWMPSTV